MNKSDIVSWREARAEACVTVSLTHYDRHSYGSSDNPEVVRVLIGRPASKEGQAGNRRVLTASGACVYSQSVFVKRPYSRPGNYEHERQAWPSEAPVNNGERVLIERTEKTMSCVSTTTAKKARATLRRRK